MSAPPPAPAKGPYDAPPPYAPQYNQQQGYPPPGSAPAPAPAQGMGPAVGPTVVVQPIHTNPVGQVVIVGGCPNCRVGVLQDNYGCCAIFLAIFFFPIGILCCLAMRERRCSNCNTSF